MAQSLLLDGIPELPLGYEWSYDVELARTILVDSYLSAHRVLCQEDGDKFRLHYHSDRISKELVPILQALESEGLPQGWVSRSAEVLGGLLVDLERAAASTDQEYVAKMRIEMPNTDLLQPSDQMHLKKTTPIKLIHTGWPGRPCKLIDTTWLEEATKPNCLISLKLLAESLRVHCNTLRRKLKEVGLYKRFSSISNTDLDALLKMFKVRRPESGLSYITGFLRRHGMRVQGARIRQSYKRVNTLGRVLRRNERILRREYGSPRPNFCWHGDGHHKLIRWGFVIHGFIDGYCRTVRVAHNLYVHTTNFQFHYIGYWTTCKYK